jgi:hypothetical protein
MFVAALSEVNAVSSSFAHELSFFIAMHVAYQHNETRYISKHTLQAKAIP